MKTRTLLGLGGTIYTLKISLWVYRIFSFLWDVDIKRKSEKDKDRGRVLRLSYDALPSTLLPTTRETVLGDLGEDHSGWGKQDLFYKGDFKVGVEAGAKGRNMV